MRKSKVTSNLMKIIIGFYIIVNFALSFCNDATTMMFELNDRILGYAIFGETLVFLLSLCFFVFEIILIILLFIKPSKLKLVSNILLQILCALDVFLCIYYLIKGITGIGSLFEILLDLIFILLILLTQNKGTQGDA